jgi:hypothetical protein
MQEEAEAEWGGKNWPPLSQLALRMRLAKYTPSKQELEMLMKCRREMLVSYAKAAFFSSAVAWTVSYRLKFFNRVFLTAGTNEPLDANSLFFLYFVK